MYHLVVFEKKKTEEMEEMVKIGGVSQKKNGKRKGGFFLNHT